jgi:class 3 adenylate cyclase/CHASE2 domain-containing sensor protein
MDSQNVQRKLTAILSADVEGYTRLMSEDDIATVQSLKHCRKIMASVIETYRGRVVDSPGDNLLAEFASVMDATQCAVRIQSALDRHNSPLPENRRMKFRIGINLGDVIQDGSRIYGDGVNIAARLEGLAEAGGICISGSVYDQVKNKLSLEFDYLGDRAVKNISDPVSVYRVIWQAEALSLRAKKKGRAAGWHLLGGSKRPLLTHISITCLVMMIVMPFINYLNVNLLTKIWQCRVALLPNSQSVTVVAIEPGEHKKMNMKKGEEQPPPYLSNPRMWRQYHPAVIKILHDLGAEAVGFDFWFSPATDDPTKLATQKFVEGLRWSRENDFPVVLGQAQNVQDPEIYKAADWGNISLEKDLTWINRVMYLNAWDTLKLAGTTINKPSLFVQVLARKLRLTPEIDGKGVHLIGKRIPRRLWMAYAQTPFKKVAYHEVYNGWADKASFSGRIALIGLSGVETDYFQTPFSPRDFTPDDKDDSYGMPGVFLYAHAINQILNGYYHDEVNDEWFGFIGGTGFSIAELESLIIMLLEIIVTCLVLYGVKFLVHKKRRVRLNGLVMSVTAVALIVVLAVVPVLFGLANFLIAALVFIPLAARQMLPLGYRIRREVSEKNQI